MLKRLLFTVATVGGEPAGHYKLEAHEISEALESLNRRTGVSPDEMAQLEFLYIDALDDSEHGIPNLERQIAESPALEVAGQQLIRGLPEEAPGRVVTGHRSLPPTVSFWNPETVQDFLQHPTEIPPRRCGVLRDRCYQRPPFESKKSTWNVAMVVETLLAWKII